MTVVGDADLTTLIAGVDAAATVAESVSVTAGPVGGVMSSADAEATYTVGSSTSFGEWPNGLAGASDLDDDGTADIAIGNAGYNLGSSGGEYTGQVYIVLGPVTSGTSDLLFADATITGSEPLTGLGAGLEMPGDLDGDGRGELMGGAPYLARYGANSGASFLFYGGFSGTLTPADADAAFYGDTTNWQTGYGQDAADLTGDGVVDLILGSPYADGDATTAGVVSILPGSAP